MAIQYPTSASRGDEMRRVSWGRWPRQIVRGDGRPIDPVIGARSSSSPPGGEEDDRTPATFPANSTGLAPRARAIGGGESRPTRHGVVDSRVPGGGANPAAVVPSGPDGAPGGTIFSAKLGINPAREMRSRSSTAPIGTRDCPGQGRYGQGPEKAISI